MTGPGNSAKMAPKHGKSPNTSMENRVRLNTCVVEGRREANTVDAINAAFVERDAGNSWRCAFIATIVKREDINDHEPAAHGPDRVTSSGLGQGLENRAEARSAQ